MNDTMRFESGHELRDNGVGDYNFFCPDRAEKLFFIPRFVVMLVVSVGLNPYRVCPNCNKAIGAQLEEPNA